MRFLVGAMVLSVVAAACATAGDEAVSTTQTPSPPTTTTEPGDPDAAQFCRVQGEWEALADDLFEQYGLSELPPEAAERFMRESTRLHLERTAVAPPDLRSVLEAATPGVEALLRLYEDAGFVESQIDLDASDLLFAEYGDQFDAATEAASLWYFDHC